MSQPGSNGSDWRLHARYEPARGRFTHLVVAEASTVEALCCVAVQPGDANGADFITRIGWRSVRLFDMSGKGFDLLAALPEDGAELSEHQVQVRNGRDRVLARLILARKPADARQRQQVPVQRKASRKPHKTDPRTLHTAHCRLHDAADVPLTRAGLD